MNELSRSADPSAVPVEGQEVDWLQVHETHNLGRRAIAAMLDLVLLAVVYVIFAAASGVSRSYNHYVGTGKTRTLQHVTEAYLSPGLLLLYIAICFLYFILLEWRFGWTFGKLLFSIRVVNTSEERLSFKQSVVRNLMRAVDGLPFVIPYMMGYGRALGDPDRRRWGDILAKSLVIDAV